MTLIDDNIELLSFYLAGKILTIVPITMNPSNKECYSFWWDIIGSLVRDYKLYTVHWYFIPLSKKKKKRFLLYERFLFPKICSE